MCSVFFHVDLDAFFASVEQADHPEYKGKPVIVGAKPGNRGVVSTCSYEARKFGVHSAMPISIAYRKCSHAVFLPVRIDRYLEVSQIVMAVLQDFTPVFQQISIDEATLDMTGTQKLFGQPAEVAAAIKAKILAATGLTISVGIAPNKYIAKLASEYRKPDGLYQVKPGEEQTFLDGLKLNKLWGIGEKMLARLTELNITTVPQLRRFPKQMLCTMLGDGCGTFLYTVARGEDPGIHSEKPKSHTISNEITFETDKSDQFFLNNVMLQLAHQVMFRLIQEDYTARTVQLKVRYHDFTTFNNQKTMRHNICSADEIYAIAKDLFYKKWDNHTSVRLLGIGLAGLTDKPEHNQQELFSEFNDKKNKVEEAVFKINKKMQMNTVVKASLLNKKEKDQPG